MQPLEPFRGGDDQDVTSWLTDLEELFDAAKQKPEERLATVPMYLTDDAKQWYRVRGPYDSWPDFKTAFTNAFTSSAHKLKTSAQLYNRRQSPNESIQTYYYDVMRLCTRLNPEMPPNERLLHLLRGLKPSLAQTIIMLNPRDCSELLEQGKRAEAAAFISQTTVDSSSPSEPVMAVTSAAIQSPTNSRSRSTPPNAASCSRYDTSEPDDRSYPFHPPGQFSTRHPKPIRVSDSFYRGPASFNQHSIRSPYSNAPTFVPATSYTNPPRYQNRNRQSTARVNLSCYTCGGYGHLARNCPTPRNRLNF